MLWKENRKSDGIWARTEDDIAIVFAEQLSDVLKVTEPEIQDDVRCNPSQEAKRYELWIGHSY